MEQFSAETSFDQQAANEPQNPEVLESSKLEFNKKTSARSPIYILLTLYIVVCILIGISGYILSGSIVLIPPFRVSNQPTKTPSSQETHDVTEDVGARFADRFAGVEAGGATIHWYAFSESERSGSTSKGNENDPFSRLRISLRKIGQKYPFQTLETDKDGGVTLRGIPAGQYEVSYDWFNQYSGFGGWNIQSLYAYARNGKQEVLPTEWFALDIVDGEQNIEIPLQPYKPQQVFVLNRGSFITLFDPKIEREIGSYFASSGQSVSNKRFQIIGNDILYLTSQSDLAAYNLSTSYEQNKITHLSDLDRDMELFQVSPQEKSVAYIRQSSIGNELKFRSNESACGSGNIVWDNGNTTYVGGSSNPYSPLSLSFISDTSFVFVGNTENDKASRVYMGSCSGDKVIAKPISVYQSEGGWVVPTFLNNDVILLYGALQTQPTNIPSPSAQISGQDNGVTHLYKISTGELKDLGHIFSMPSLLFSSDRSFLISLGEEIKILNVQSLISGDTNGVTIPKSALFTDPARSMDGKVWMNGDHLFVYDLYSCQNNQLCAKIKTVQISGSGFKILEEAEVKNIFGSVELVGVLENAYAHK